MPFKVLFILLFCLLTITHAQYQYCSHPIFCNQTVLKAVSNSTLFQNDFKQFVDLVLKVPVQTALDSFRKDSVQNFVKNNFISSDSILQPLNLPDFVEKPSHFSVIKDQELLNFAYELNKRWNQLARKVNLDFSRMGTCKTQCSTFLDVLDQKTLIIPGGRFKQGYYWDSYWIVKGLIASGMLDTAQNVVRNFLVIIKKYGLIPNGFRKYYLNRSQPPFLCLMVKDVTAALYQKGRKQQADKLEQDAFEPLVLEYNFWQKYKTKTVTIRNKQFTMNVYNANTTTARPESYRQDIKVVSSITNEEDRKRIFKSISSIAESGWDFSSRWFKNPNELLSTIIDEIVPTDLNTILALNEAYLVKLAEKYKRQDLQTYFLKRIKQRKEYFATIKQNDGRYPDYKSIPSLSVYPTDFYPYLLFPESLNIQKVYNSTVNPVSSKIANGQQWDSPNVWAPNNWILHEILPNQKAFEFAQQWVSTVYCSWKKQGAIYQKYRNDKLGVRGEGGQYTVQTGFGWSNGLAMYYMMLYPNELVAPNLSKCGM